MQEENGDKLWFLVEASGHINFDVNMKTDQKGLYNIEGYQKGELAWKTWKFPVDYKNISSMKAKEEEDESWGKCYPRIL